MEITRNRPKYDIDWSFYRELPLREVYETLFQLSEEDGTMQQRGRYLWVTCQAEGHNDKTPSVQIKNNRCTCWACRQLNSGSAIDVVMTAFHCTPLEAVKTLDKYFPGGLRILEENEQEEERKLQIPKYPNSFYREIGLKTNPFHPFLIKGGKDSEEFKEDEKYKYQSLVSDAAGLVIDKLHEAENGVRKEIQHIQETYPSLSPKGLAEIKKDGIDKILYYEEKVEEFRKLMRQAMEIEEEEKMEDWIDCLADK